MHGHKSIRESLLDEFVYSIVAPRVDLSLGSLTSAGLMKINAPRALTDCEADGYGESVLWAQAIHAHHSALAGLYWVARRYNEGRAMVLFGDRIAAEELQAQQGPMPLRYFQTEIDDIAARCDIDINRR